MSSVAVSLVNAGLSLFHRSETENLKYFKTLLIFVRTNFEFFKGHMATSPIKKYSYTLRTEDEELVVRGIFLIEDDLFKLKQQLDVLEDAVEDFESCALEDQMSIVKDAEKMNTDLKKRHSHLSNRMELVKILISGN